MLDIRIDRDVCITCGACIAACGRGVFTDDGKGGPEVPPENERLCNFCGHCSAVCPVGAIVSPGYGGERAVPLADIRFEYAAAKEFILSCRSMRRFKEEPVAREEILELLDVARKAPTASNAQGVRWLVLSDREKMRRFTALTMEWFDTVVRHDPLWGARYNVDSLMARYKSGYDPIMRGAPCAVFAATDAAGTSAYWGPVDAAIAMTYFCLAANAKNIGSCWAGFGMRALAEYAPLREFMGLDDDTAVRAITFFGYPALEYHAVPPRKPLTVTWV